MAATHFGHCRHHGKRLNRLTGTCPICEEEREARLASLLPARPPVAERIAEDGTDYSVAMARSAAEGVSMVFTEPLDPSIPEPLPPHEEVADWKELVEEIARQYLVGCEFRFVETEVAIIPGLFVRFAVFADVIGWDTRPTGPGVRQGTMECEFVDISRPPPGQNVRLRPAALVNKTMQACRHLNEVFRLKDEAQPKPDDPEPEWTVSGPGSCESPKWTDDEIERQQTWYEQAEDRLNAHLRDMLVGLPNIETETETMPAVGYEPEEARHFVVFFSRAEWKTTVGETFREMKAAYDGNIKNFAQHACKYANDAYRRATGENLWPENGVILGIDPAALIDA